MDECSGNSSYEASAIVEAFHSIPRRDIDLNETPSQFSLELSYYEAVIIWICAPIILCICVFILLSVYYICICCCCCCRQKKRRSKTGKRTCACLVCILIILCLGIIGGSLYAEVELNRDITEAIESGENINDTVGEVVNQVSNYPVSEVTAAVDELMNIVNQSSVLEDLNVIEQTNMDINQSFTSIVEALTDNETSFFYTDALTNVSLYETVRHWSLIGYLSLVAILLIVIFITVVCFSPTGLVVVLVFLCIFTFTVWIAVGGALGLGIVLSDICSDPDAIVRNISSSDPLALNVTNYYISCQCDPFAKYKDQLNAAIQEVDNSLMQVDDYISNIADETDRMDAKREFDIINTNIEAAEALTNNITELLLCQEGDGINVYYEEAVDSLCTNGFVYSLVQFSLLAGLAIILIVLICCSTFFSGLLVSSKKGDEYDERDIVAFDTEHTAASWANRRSSYSEPYISNGSTFNAPKDTPGLVSVAPPNYTDLHATRTSARFSGEYDHFDA